MEGLSYSGLRYTIPEFTPTTADLAALKAAFIADVWGIGGVPATGADSVDLEWDGGPIGLAGCAHVDLLNFDLPLSGTAVAHLCHATSPNGKLAVMHGGHGVSHPWYHSDCGQQAMAEALLGAGYDVLGVDQPLNGSQPNPLVLDGGISCARDGSGNHNTMTAIDAAGQNSFVYFLDPVLRGINQLATGYSAIYMVGLSGGGWTTDIVAMLDSRVTRSSTVFGSLPFGWRQFPVADYEQITKHPTWLSLPDYFALYALGVVGGRSHIHVLSDTEPVFPVRYLHRWLDWMQVEVNYRLTINSATGTWTYWIDATATDHGYYAATIAHILAAWS